MTSRLLKQLCELDIFTLMVFKNIYETGHANCTARDLAVSAPKVSRCLAALRLAFDDELFYRRQQKLKPTPLAESLYQPVCDFIHSVHRLEQQVHQSRQPSNDICIHIAVAHGLLCALAMKLGLKNIQQQLGQVRLYPWQDDSAEKIHRGQLDLGICLEHPEQLDLILSSLGQTMGVCVVSREDHPLWQRSPAITLEDISQYTFVYLTIKGFNERMDPMELFCQQEGIPLSQVHAVHDREEWHAHLLTMGSVAFSTPNEMALIEGMPGLRVQHLPETEVTKLHRAFSLPSYSLVEKAPSYRRYSEQQRKQLLALVTQELYPKAEY
ncbi:LysR family transcriptional regulator [Shewanella algae]|uniref:LysR family transcriptional regulator n=1 Tax=Shewanella algae TaxID=38313 RepID=UPI0034D4D50E